MPLYDYRCGRCGDFRALAPMREAASPQPCPACGEACARTLSAPFLGAAGSGGWLTDPRGGAARGGWRSACGLGCTHAGCR